ncbi:MAG TPA: agmatine deiminase family protein [Phycisphaerae bacterium]|nr:agmatine deiminase family protein [Phycisphaerae bacterium]
MTTRLISIVAMVSLVLAFAWQVAAAPPQNDIEQIKAKYPDGLPRYMTPEEAQLPFRRPTLEDYDQRTPPSGTVYTPPEYAPCAGLFFAWEGYTSILTTLIVDITTLDPVANAWVVVDTTSEQSSVYSTLSAAGANMSRVQFIVRTTDTVWIRDYGPRFIFEDGNLAIIDHTYNRPRPNDDAFNDYLATLWAIPQYDLPLTHGGGNFHLFANHDAFMTSLIVDENPSYTAAQIQNLFLQYENVNLTIYTGFPTSFDSTRHIDMWMLPVGDNKVVIGQYSPSTGQPYTITEGAVADLTSRGYTVYRTPGWQSSGTHYTYTNGVICNNLLFISRFGGSFTTQDAQALSVYQTACPGKTIIQVNNADIITAAGAMHCIVMHVPQFNVSPQVTVNSPNGGETWYIGDSHNITWTATDDVGVTSVDIYYSTDGGSTFPYTIATGEANDGVFPWIVPNNLSTQCRVKAVAHDGDGHTGEDVSNANFTIAVPPVVRQPIYSYPLDTDPGWSTEAQWAFGHPTGGGSHNHDPNNGYTGTNVYGYNLNGDYPKNLSPAKYLTTTAIDCTGLGSVELWFRRWLGVDAPAYASATIQVSNNGTTWTTVYQNPTAQSDNQWLLMKYDISAVANNQPTVYIRWGMGPTTADASTYPGWNIDDVQIWAVLPTCDLPGDMNGDGEVDGRDMQSFLNCYIAGTPHSGGCDCADMDISNSLNALDIQQFANALVQ